MTHKTFIRPRGRAGAALAAAVATLLGAAAQAQTAPEDSGAIAEVVVTAQKRTESLQAVPVSVTALTANQLGELKMDSPSDLTTQIPNLQVNGIVGEGSPIFSLRGVSMFDYSLSQSSPVASYIDEVYKGNFVLFGVEMYDLQRVEVLRGPQGTLYGKNTTGGAINFVTRRPGFDTEGEIKLGFGNYGRQEAEGAFQTALIDDRLAMRFAFTYTKMDGFIHNVLPGQPDMEGVNQYGVRLSLLYKISEDATATLRLSKSMQDPQNYAIIAGNISAGNIPWGAIPPGAIPGVGGVGYYRTVDGNPGSTPLANDQVAQNYTPKRRQDNDGVSLTVDWKLGQTLALTSITSWDQGSLFNPEGTDGSPLDIFKIPYIGKTKQIAQDLRLTSSTGGAFDYIVGAYYQHEVIYNSTENQFYNFLDFNDDGAVNAQDCVDSSSAPADAGTGTGYASGFVINPSCRYYNQFDQIRNSWSVYSDASYKLSEIVKLRAGVRYNHDNASQQNALDQLRGPDEVPIANLGFFAPLPGGGVGPDPAVAVDATRRQDVHNTAVTGRAGIDITPTHDALIYFSYSRGYRSAAFNAQFLFTPEDFTSVKPETLDSLELGFKTAWAQNRLQLNGAVFHYQYKNQQYIDVQPTGQQPLINLAKSKIDGGELELVTRPVRDFTLRVGLGFLDGTIQEGAIAAGTVDVSGHKLPNAPTTSATMSADWDALHFGDSRLTLHFDGSYASKQYFELLNEDRIAQDAYSILNARIAFHGGGDKWEIGAWGRNLADKYYLTNAVDLQALGYDYEHRGLPRMYGLDASYRF